MKDGFAIRNAKNRGKVLTEHDFKLPRAIEAAQGDLICAVFVALSKYIAFVYEVSCIVMFSIVNITKHASVHILLCMLYWCYVMCM